jgi:hypothetical protein
MAEPPNTAGLCARTAHHTILGDSHMVPLLSPVPRIVRFRINQPCFGFRTGEEINVIESARAIHGQLVAIEFNGRKVIARYLGQSVKLPDGCETFIYRHIGVVEPR